MAKDSLLLYCSNAAHLSGPSSSGISASANYLSLRIVAAAVRGFFSSHFFCQSGFDTQRFVDYWG